ncbi:hypothetical protein [Sphingosinithalassobacter sp. CS137]|uniref:hypothetical protein n=1 Tax=Sphingosinithalassobacter sp. CS137 TaxID=2762748 RepID=UPI00165D48FA|nr:hypothetical protein [Sphingosinithalassobacter sp. CS137]
MSPPRAIHDQIAHAAAERAEGAVRIPHDDRDTGTLRLAPGLADASFHQRDDSAAQTAVRAAAAAFGRAVRHPSPDALAHLDALWAETGAVTIADALIERIRGEALAPEAAANVARSLARRSPHPSSVKLAIVLLGYYGTADDLPLLSLLARWPELTLFATVAAAKLAPDPHRAVYAIARGSGGWGRVQAIRRLWGATDPDIRDWLLRDGHRTMMADEIAAECAEIGGLFEALARPTLDEPMLDSLTELIGNLVHPDSGIGYFEEPGGAQAVADYLRHLSASPLTVLRRFLTVDAMRQALHAEQRNPAPPDGWTDADLRSLAVATADYLARPHWRSVAEGLSVSEDPSDFWQACRVGAACGLDVWLRRYERLIDRRGEDWLELMQTDDPARVERLLDVARARCDLSAIGSGPGLEKSFAPETAEDDALATLVQELDRFPGTGWDLVRIALSGRLMRARYMALRTLERWGADRWPADAVEALLEARAREPDAELAARIDEVLGRSGR